MGAAGFPFLLLPSGAGAFRGRGKEIPWEALLRLAQGETAPAQVPVLFSAEQRAKALRQRSLPQMYRKNFPSLADRILQVCIRKISAK